AEQLNPLPDLKQIQWFVNRQRTPASAPFTDHQLRTYCENNSAVPEDPDKPFVLGYDRECEEKKRLYFRISGSNKYIFASSTSQITEKADLKGAYDKIFVNGAQSWSEYFESRFEAHLVQPTSRCLEPFYECSCRQGSKKEVYRHATMVMCGIEKIVAYSAEATAAPMKTIVARRSLL
ncbi:hypothetical protein AAVH_41310, partial [Aphelenchoides avenae]